MALIALSVLPMRLKVQYGMDLTSLGFSGCPLIMQLAMASAAFLVSILPVRDAQALRLAMATLMNFVPWVGHFVTAVLNAQYGYPLVTFLVVRMRIYREDDSFKSNQQSGFFTFNNTLLGWVAPPVMISEGSTSVCGVPAGISVDDADRTRFRLFRILKTWGFFVHGRPAAYQEADSKTWDCAMNSNSRWSSDRIRVCLDSTLVTRSH
jgi:hypothetical protein